MQSELLTELKKDMGYTDQPNIICAHCINVEITENPFIDRDWIHTCIRYKELLGTFTVSATGRCNYATFNPKHT
jgi:hypothetical protein